MIRFQTNLFSANNKNIHKKNRLKLKTDKSFVAFLVNASFVTSNFNFETFNIVIKTKSFVSLWKLQLYSSTVKLQKNEGKNWKIGRFSHSKEKFFFKDKRSEDIKWKIL